MNVANQMYDGALGGVRADLEDLQQKIERVWAEHHVEPTGHDMTNECRLAAAILALRAELAAAPHLCVPATVKEAIILKHSPSILPGDCVVCRKPVQDVRALAEEFRARAEAAEGPRELLDLTRELCDLLLTLAPPLAVPQGEVARRAAPTPRSSATGQDSTGKTTRVGDRVRYDGEAYTIQELGPHLQSPEGHPRARISRPGFSGLVVEWSLDLIQDDRG